MSCLAATLTPSDNHIITKAAGFLITFAPGKFIALNASLSFEHGVGDSVFEKS